MNDLISREALLKEFAARARAARNWKENALNNGDEEIVIRATATLDFLTEVKLTIEGAPTVEVGYLTNCANCERVEKIRAKRTQGECNCSQCDYFKFSKSFIENIVEVMTEYNIKSIEDLMKEVNHINDLLKGGAKK